MKIKPFIFESVFFIVSLLLGIFSSEKLVEIFREYQSYSKSINIWSFLVWFAVGTVVLVWLTKYVRKRRKSIFKVLFLVSVLFGSLSFFDLWLSSILSFIVVAVLVFLWMTFPRVWIHNIFLVFAIAGIGSRLGLNFPPNQIVFMQIIFSIYDYIAVYKTKHMIYMAEGMVEEEAVLGIVIPQTIPDFNAKLSLLKERGRLIVLGAGDILFPLIFAVSFVPQGINKALLAGLFSYTGLFLSYIIFSLKKKPIPAMPPIALLSVIGYFIINAI